MAKITNIPTTSAPKVDQVSPAHSKTSSISSSITAPPSGTITNNDKNVRSASMTEEEILQRNLQDLMDKKNREERKANGRLVAVILASILIFLAMYHAWIRRSRILAGILVPAVIMVSFGGWVVVLAKRDKAKRAIFDKYLEEVAERNKQELEAKKLKSHKKPNEQSPSNETIIQYVNEKLSKDLSPTTKVPMRVGSAIRAKDHRKNRRHRKVSGDSSSNESSTSLRNSSHYATKDLRIKRPSIRQKLFRQARLYHITPGGGGASSGRHQNTTTHSLVQAVMATTPTIQPPLMGGPNLIGVHHVKGQTSEEIKRKRLQRLDALQAPAMVRMGSAP